MDVVERWEAFALSSEEEKGSCGNHAIHYKASSYAHLHTGILSWKSVKRFKLDCLHRVLVLDHPSGDYLTRNNHWLPGSSQLAKGT